VIPVEPMFRPGFLWPDFRGGFQETALRGRYQDGKRAVDTKSGDP
jgi:hypothetical protein